MIILSDQHAGWALSSTGAKHVETPSLDRLADDGVMFTNAYTTSPVCMPARVSLMTGRMPGELGMNYNGAVDNFYIRPTFGDLMKNTGYDTGWVGKTHLRPSADHGLDTVVDFNHDDARSIMESLNFIKKERDKPFFLVTNFMRSHDIAQYARKLANYPVERLQKLPQGELEDPPPEDQLPPLPENFQIPEHEPSVLREKVVPAHPRVYPLVDADERTWREFRWAYGRLVEQMDADIGELLQALRDAALYDDMLIIYLSEHGDGAGEHQWNQKQVLYEASVRVPLIIKPPKNRGDKHIGRVDRNNVVSAILDLMPTVADYAQVRAPSMLHGRSIRPLVESADSEAVHEYIVSETTFGSFAEGHHGVTGRMVRTPQYKYIVYDQGDNREQLFDMLDDPGETTDLTVRPQYVQVLQEHRAYLRQWIQKTDDFFDRVPADSK
ncbi:MAG: sulfatase-like hydrolase/transferase [Balneolales bacterium]